MYSEDLHCPYDYCHLYCRSEAAHRAKYATMYWRRKKRINNVNHIEQTIKKLKSDRFNYKLAEEVLGVLPTEAENVATCIIKDLINNTIQIE